jgi:hypothetical protein
MIRAHFMKNDRRCAVSLDILPNKEVEHIRSLLKDGGVMCGLQGVNHIQSQHEDLVV